MAPPNKNPDYAVAPTFEYNHTTGYIVYYYYYSTANVNVLAISQFLVRSGDIWFRLSSWANTGGDSAGTGGGISAGVAGWVDDGGSRGTGTASVGPSPIQSGTGIKT